MNPTPAMPTVDCPCDCCFETRPDVRFRNWKRTGESHANHEVALCDRCVQAYRPFQPQLRCLALMIDSTIYISGCPILN